MDGTSCGPTSTNGRRSGAQHSFSSTHGESGLNQIATLNALILCVIVTVSLPLPADASEAISSSSPIEKRSLPTAEASSAERAAAIALAAANTSGFASVVGIANVGDTAYWVARTDGTVDGFNSQGAFPGTPIPGLAAPVSAIAAKSDGQGLWLVAVDGGVFAYGTSGFYGSPAGSNLNGQMIKLVPTASGNGYWLIGADGGVFNYGDAPFWGSLPSHKNVRNVVAALLQNGLLYMIGADGWNYAFGANNFYSAAQPASYDVWLDPATTYISTGDQAGRPGIRKADRSGDAAPAGRRVNSRLGKSGTMAGTSV